MSDDDRVDAVFSALADPTRRRVMSLLSEGGPATATELSARVEVSRQAVAKHLGALADAGLVDSSVEGRERRYHLTPPPMRDAVAWMAGVGAEWDERLDRLRRRLGKR